MAQNAIPAQDVARAVCLTQDIAVTRTECQQKYLKISCAVFGFVKGILVVEMLLIVFAAYPSLNLDGAVNNSLIARHLVDNFAFLLHILPSNFDHRIDQFLTPPQPA